MIIFLKKVSDNPKCDALCCVSHVRKSSVFYKTTRNALYDFTLPTPLLGKGSSILRTSAQGGGGFAKSESLLTVYRGGLKANADVRKILG